MHRLCVLIGLTLAVAVHAQPAPDAKPREEQKMDAAAKARIRVEGAAGGTGARVPQEAAGGATVGDGSQHRHAPPKPPDPKESDTYNEKSSERDEARGARGAIR